MKYNIKAKQTYFNGIRFRSMLEAKWAAFFMLQEWKWEYEPYEINGRVPDFIIYCDENSNYETNEIIVEVKPKKFITEDFKNKILDSYGKESSHILLLHESPFYTYDEREFICIGLVSQYFKHECTSFKWRKETGFYNAEMKCIGDFGSYYMSWDAMIGKHPEIDRKHWVYNGDVFHHLIQTDWNISKNNVQFKSYNNG